MSMLSAQCDILRETAELIEDHGRVGFGDLIITDPLMVDAAKEMRDAADTIWQLRCDCVELRGQMDDAKHDLSIFSGRIVELEAENAKLRERVAELEELLPENGRWYRAETVEAYVAEIAKLRELVRDYEHCTMHADCARCEYDGKMSTHCPLSPCFPDIDELHELGVEVP